VDDKGNYTLQRSASDHVDRVLRHAAIELDELRAYKSFADDLIVGWRNTLSRFGDGGEKLQPVFIHQPYKHYDFYIDWSLVSEVDLVQIAKTSEWLRMEAKRIRERIEIWLIQNEMIHPQCAICETAPRNQGFNELD